MEEGNFCAPLGKYKLVQPLWELVLWSFNGLEPGGPELTM